MANYLAMNRDELTAEKAALEAKYKEFQAKGLKLNMARGKPGPHQMDLAMDLLKMNDYTTDAGTDARNYGELEGLQEARVLFADVFGVKPEEVFVGGNSSLQLMYNLVNIGYVFGFPESPCPWSQVEKRKFLCPVPGYDRHFAITEEFGFELVSVPMTPNGPDMDIVEKLVAEDPDIKGIWCVPQYSNPDGYTYSDETIERFAKMKTAAPDFKIFWDEAYIVHHLTDEIIETPVLLNESKKYGNENRVFMFTSTSKITFPGAGVSAIACSESSMKYICKRFSVMIISYDKMNQLRHVRFLKNKEGVLAHMAKHRRRLVPCFDAVKTAFKNNLIPCGDIAHWTDPKGRLLHQPVCDARLCKARGGSVQGCGPDPDRCRFCISLSQRTPRILTCALRPPIPVWTRWKPLPNCCASVCVWLWQKNCWLTRQTNILILSPLCGPSGPSGVLSQESRHDGPLAEIIKARRSRRSALEYGRQLQELLLLEVP